MNGAISSLATMATVAGCVGLALGSATLGLSTAGAAAFLAVWLIAMAPHLRMTVRLPFQTLGLWIFPAVAAASVLWSTMPGATLRAAVQFALTVAFAILAARLLSPRRFVAAAMLALIAVAALCLLFGRVMVDRLDGTVTFVGIFASKNQFSFFIGYLLVFCAGVLLDRRQPTALRLAALAGLLAGAPLLVLARSAGALVATAMGLGTFAVIAALAALRRDERAILAGGAAMVGVPALALLGTLAAAGVLGAAFEEFVTEVLGKSMTFTGRTVLWDYATVLIGDRPVLGHGYYAIWQHGNPIAERVWREFHIPNRGGFHFHNTFIETATGTGMLGAVAIAVTILLALLRGVKLALSHYDPATAALVATTASIAARSIFEVEVTFPFQIGGFLLFAAATYAADHARASARQHAAAAFARAATPAGRHA